MPLSIVVENFNLRIYLHLRLTHTVYHITGEYMPLILVDLNVPRTGRVCHQSYELLHSVILAIRGAI